ncbi:hypothetical protein Tco_1089026, partial [Tanacetum coccineum]
EEPEEGVDIELEDDAELIIPYEGKGDKRPPLFATFRAAYLRIKSGREKERELLNHDLENVERTLGNVLERMSVLESGENATLKKRLAETETKLVWARMEPVVLEPVVLKPVVLEPVVLEPVVL